MPKRIQRKRTKGWKMPAGTVAVSRPSKWGNPYTVEAIGMTEWIVCEWGEAVSEKTRSRASALALALRYYRLWAELQIDLEPDFLAPLRGKDLVCWCAEDKPCHADILLELANS